MPSMLSLVVVVVCLTSAVAQCPKCSGYTCDEWIQWDARKYTCNNLQKDWGCYCTACSSCGGPAPRPDAGAASLVMLSSSRFPEARCLDGSMAGYYLRKGTTNKYLLYFEGGGWCYDSQCSKPTMSGTIKDCKSRAQGKLGSSRNWPSSQTLDGMLSADGVENPVFSEWSVVYLPYCDGTSWTGNSSVEGLHFKGKAILASIIQELQSTTAIQKAEQVVISGGSAGASAVFYHADTLAQSLQLESGEVLALPDAGFFLDLRDKDGIDCWPSQMRSLFDVANGYDSLHSGCLARYPHEKWRCMFPQYYADLMATRTLSIMSLYDSSELWCTLRLDCEANDGGQYPQCSGKELKDFQALRGEHIRAWAPLVQKKGNGVWSPSCITHTMTWAHWTDKSWEVPASSGNTMASVVTRWLAPNASQQHFVFQDEVAWPGNKACAGSDSRKKGKKRLGYEEEMGRRRTSQGTHLFDLITT